MTPKQRDVLDFIGDYWRDNRIAPTFREIAAGLGIVSHSNAYERAMSLVAQGLVEHEPQAIRSLRLTEKGRALWSGSRAA